jgi:hypothetical protein
MKRGIAVFLSCLFFIIAVLSGCHTLDNTSIGKGVKRYEGYSDDLGRKRDVKVLGKDVVVEPEADRKIRFSF